MSNKRIVSLSYFGKRESTLITGIAIVLMFIHHFFGFADWLLENVEWRPVAKIGDRSIEFCVAKMGWFCVHIFAFISGYVMWKQQDDYTSFRPIFLRAAKFLVCYWIICALFWVYAAAVGDVLPSLPKMIKNLFGFALSVRSNDVCVSFAWYVRYYICLLALAPLLLFLFSKGIRCDSVALMLVFFFSSLYGPHPLYISTLWPLFCSAMGILSAKYAVFERIRRGCGRTLPWWISAAGIVVVVYCRYELLKTSFLCRGMVDPVLVIFFIYFFIELFNGLRSAGLEKVVAFMGTYSMNLWFIHSIFFTGQRFLQPLLYAPRYSILVLLWGLVMCLPVAWAISKVQRRVLSYLGINRSGIRYEKDNEMV